jgi:hypothetical protein
MAIKNFLLIILFLFAFSCRNKSLDTGNKPVAKVGDYYLYLSEIKEIVPDNLSKTDSAMVAESYINQWVKKTLKLNKADLNLTLNQKDVGKQLEEYRSSLLIFKYEQMLIGQKLDTVVNDQEIEAYYRDFNEQFTLDRDVVKAELIKIDKGVPKIRQLKNWLHATGDRYQEEISDYCHNFAKRFDNFKNDWVYLDLVVRELPVSLEKIRHDIKKGFVFETQDSAYQYFIKFFDFKPKGSRAPLSIVRKDIKDILLNKRKIQIIKDLDEKLYREALKKNEITIFKDI